MAEAPAVTRVLGEPGAHVAEVTVYLDIGQETKVRGPARRGRQEALKDCIELRKVAAKSTNDPSLFKLRQRVKELQDTVWTAKDLGGRQLDGAEGPPPGFVLPRSAAPVPAPSSTAASRPAEGGPRLGARKFMGAVRGAAVSQECTVEVADVRDAVPASASEDWALKAEVALRKAFGQFGPVLQVRLDEDAEDGEPVASIRFATPKAAEAAMVKARLGFLPLGPDRQVRVRQPAAAEAIWRTFPRRRPSADAAEAAASGPAKKKLRPNERFASRGAEVEATDESERFWEAQSQKRGAPAEPPKQAVPEPPPEPPAPAAPAAPPKPAPCQLEPGAGEEDQEVARGEAEVAVEMEALLGKPFSQQRKALKAIRLRWHPDKNPDRQAVATRVFQFIQAHDAWLAHHELA